MAVSFIGDVPGQNHQHVAGHLQTLSQYVYRKKTKAEYQTYIKSSHITIITKINFVHWLTQLTGRSDTYMDRLLLSSSDMHHKYSLKNLKVKNINM